MRVAVLWASKAPATFMQSDTLVAPPVNASFPLATCAVGCDWKRAHPVGFATERGILSGKKG